MMSHSDRSAAAIAVDRLNALLTRLSVTKLKDIGLAGKAGYPEVEILGHIEVLGRGHTLACAVRSSAEPEVLRLAAENLRNFAAGLPGSVTQLIVVPYLSAGARVLCRQNEINFMDLCGNAYLAIDEVFISTRSFPGAAASAAPALPVKADDADAGHRAGVNHGFPPHRAEVPPKESGRVHAAVANSR